jgi:hypothetical protein
MDLKSPISLGNQEEEAKNAGAGVPLLPHDEEYIGFIGDVQLRDQADFNNPTVMVERINVNMLVLSTKDGQPVIDSNGKAVEPMSLMLTRWGINPSSTGFQKDGTASLFRQLIAYSTGQNVVSELHLNSLEDLKDKFIAFQVIQKKDSKGVVKTRINQFRKLPVNFAVPGPESISAFKSAYGAIMEKINKAREAQAGSVGVTAGKGQEPKFVDV